jgi:hypothetical protein
MEYTSMSHAEFVQACQDIKDAKDTNGELDYIELNDNTDNEFVFHFVNGTTLTVVIPDGDDDAGLGWPS